MGVHRRVRGLVQLHQFAFGIYFGAWVRAKELSFWIEGHGLTIYVGNRV